MSKIVYDTDDWLPGYTLMLLNLNNNINHLPVDVDNLVFTNCILDVLDLSLLLDDCLKTLRINSCTIREIRGLPVSLKHLHICGGQIQNIELPNNLKVL